MSCWALGVVSELDLVRPGLAGHYLRTSFERRQVIAAYLSRLPFERRRKPIIPTDVEQQRSIADLLLTGTHMAILQEGFGTVPAGMRQALGRSGPISHQPRFYTLLRFLLADGRRPYLAKTLGLLDDIDMNRLVVLCALPRQVVSPDLIGGLRDVIEARDFSNALKLLSTRAIDEDAFIDGLRALKRKDDVRAYLESWVLRCRFAPSPIPESDQYRPVTTGGELKAKALEYRNCSRDYALDLLEGKASMAEFVSPNGSAMVMLLHRRDEWVVDDVYGRRNEPVDADVRAQALDFLRLKGVINKRRAARKDDPFSSLRRLLPRGGWA